MKFWKYIFGILFLTLVCVIIAIFQLPDKNLHVIACNVGQGDAILIIYKNTQILTDGGPSKSVLTCLGKYMPFWDRNIELVISTHPDADHITGLVDVIKNYKVEKLLISQVDPGTPVYKVLKKEVGGRGIPIISPVEGMSLGVGLIHLDILAPMGQLPINNLQFTNTETNTFSVVYTLTYGQFRAFMPGDAPPEVLDDLAAKKVVGSVNYIKIPHHGSVNGLTENLLKVLVPKVAVISVGKNTWGFPRPEIIDMLKKYGTGILRTDETGDVEIITDGIKFWTKKNGSLFSFWER
jgi:competence protein ComEC